MNENEIAFDAADIIRMGKDIFYRNLHQPTTKVYIGFVELSSSSFSHDAFSNRWKLPFRCFTNPITITNIRFTRSYLLNQNYPPLANEMKIFMTMTGVQYRHPCIATSDVPPLALCTANLNTNLLSLNDHCV